MTISKKYPVIFLGLLMITAAGFAAGTDQEKSQVDPKWRTAIEFRANMATAVASAREDPITALTRLKKAEEIKGLTTEPDADLAAAAIDIGHRLVSLGQASAAEFFFRQADETLTKMLSQEKAALGSKERAQYLRYRAHLRANFLGRPALARADIDAAIALQPDDQSLQETRMLLARGHGEEFKPATPRN